MIFNQAGGNWYLFLLQFLPNPPFYSPEIFNMVFLTISPFSKGKSEVQFGKHDFQVNHVEFQGWIQLPQKRTWGTFPIVFRSSQIPDPTDPGGSTETLGAKFGGVSEGGGEDVECGAWWLHHGQKPILIGWVWPLPSNSGK